MVLLEAGEGVCVCVCVSGSGQVQNYSLMEEKNSDIVLPSI